MSREPNPLFLAKRTYHGRRMADAARLLPILGGGLFLLPLLWKTPNEQGGTGTVQVMLYVFIVWVFLIGAAAILSRRIPRSESDPSEPEQG
ncbi:hypothetical protein [Roseovarius rhodophyticola]|uniref:Uncharacterized protein n=1 Tax=Roseovarius rhodophyticola TaxID=3080827 RepID=A0ABZ2TF97_9RHOB|nr:hypothetical protein [Roseovarius sp. W115]MDV2928620.1 hypothetical protein [Roseovarius sp. W115]